MPNRIKIGYFTAGPIPVAGELTDIALLGSAGAEVAIRNVLSYAAATYQPGSGSAEDFDYVAAHSGTTLPADYDDSGDFPVASLTVALPGFPVLSTQKVISSGVEFLGPATSGSRTDGWTPTIVAGAVTVLVGS